MPRLRSAASFLRRSCLPFSTAFLAVLMAIPAHPQPGLSGKAANWPVATEAFAETWERIDPAAWQVADYTATHPWFDVRWTPDAATADSGLSLGLAPNGLDTRRFDAASLRRHTRSHFGRYEVVMQPARGSGIISGFFTYTGAPYGTRHDEIDIEFLGRDTTIMNVALFTDGAIQDTQVPLGFDAAEKPRLYAFEWLPDRVRWYAGNRLIHEMRAPDYKIPQVPGMLFTNLWAADAEIAGWSGEIEVHAPVSTMVHCVSYAPLVDGRFLTPKLPCSDPAAH